MEAKHLLSSLGYFTFLTNLPAMLVEELQTSIFPCFESIVKYLLNWICMDVLCMCTPKYGSLILQRCKPSLPCLVVPPPVPAPAGGPGLQLPDWRGGRPAPRPPPAAGGHRAREPLAGERPDAGTRYYVHVHLPCVLGATWTTPPSWAQKTFLAAFHWCATVRWKSRARAW